MEIHAKKSVRLYLSISPPYIPISWSLIFLDDPSKFFSYFLDDGILCIWDINDYFFGSRFLSKFCDWYIFRGVVGVELNWAFWVIIVAVVGFGFIFVFHLFYYSFMIIYYSLRLYQFEN